MTTLTEKMIQHMEKSHMHTVNPGIKIDVFPQVFPPASPYSNSTKGLYGQLHELEGLTVLDVFTGTGVLAIKAALNGAKKVIATDIWPPAVKNAKHNVQKHRLEDKIEVYCSDVYDGLPPDQKYDVVIANPPILSTKPEEDWQIALYDEDWQAHEKLFAGWKERSTGTRGIIIVHADLEGKESFDRLEELACNKHGYTGEILNVSHGNGHEYRTYEFR